MIGYYGGFAALGLVSASLGPTLPALADLTGSTLRDVSYLFTARSFGYMFGAYFGGRLYDRVPGHPLVAGVLAVMAATMALVPLTSLLWTLTAVLLLLGFADGVLDAGGNTLLVWVHGRKVGPFMNGLHFCFGVGAFLAPIVVAQAVLLSGDIAWAYWALALFMLPPAIWVVRLRSPSAPELPSPSDPGSASAEPTADSRDGDRVMVPIVAFLVLYVGAEVGFAGWIYTYAVEMHLEDRVTAAYLTSVFWGAFTVGRLLAIPVSTRLGPRAVLAADLLCGAASVSLILVWPESTVALWTGTAGFGLSMASIFPTTINFAERRLTITGRVTGWFLVGASVGAMFLPWLIGQLFEALGPRVTMTTILVDVLATAVVFALLSARTRGSDGPAKSNA